MDPLTTVTGQMKPVDARQVENSAGGFVFGVSQETRIHRFLTLGVEGGTYYTTEAELTRQNAEAVFFAAEHNGEWLVNKVVEISEAGRAPKQNPTIFALAVAAAVGDDATRRLACGALPRVCRTGSQLLRFTQYCDQLRGWGRGLRTAVGDWFLGDVEKVAYQLAKYRQREGWSMRDVLRLAHPYPITPAHDALFRWVTQGRPDGDALPTFVRAFVKAQDPELDTGDLVDLIREHRLSWEMLPDVALSKPAVWYTLINNGMPLTALMRQLPRLTRLGVLDSAAVRHQVCVQLQNGEKLLKARVHPVNLLIAQRTYASGRSERGSSTWTPQPDVVDALESAFYAAFGSVRSAGKRTLVALDVSGSMGSPISGLPISCREASAALALVTVATEPGTDVIGFTGGGRGLWGSGVSSLAITADQRLGDVVRTVDRLPFGTTDCSLPMLWAMERGRKAYDTFLIYTDNETWAGNVHPHVALRQYREKTGIPARLVVVGMTSTGFSIADPADPGMLDVAGFDSAVPNLIADFSRGDV